jgi:hypothetical protein
VATPIAASLGDITSLALLSWISTVLYDAIGRLGTTGVKVNSHASSPLHGLPNYAVFSNFFVFWAFQHV